MRRFVFGLLLVSLAGPVMAEKRAKDTDQDPSKVVCKYSEEIGTRLARKKTCLTRSQWEDFERETRNTVQRVQDMKVATGN